MGYKGQLGLYLYYLLSAAALRKLSPPLALMTAQESGLSGGFRAAHQVGYHIVASSPAQLFCRGWLHLHVGLHSQSAA